MLFAAVHESAYGPSPTALDTVCPHQLLTALGLSVPLSLLGRADEVIE